MRISIPLAVTLLLTLSIGRARGDAAADLKKASDEGHPVFLVVTEGDAKGTDLGMRVSAEAAAIVGDAVVVRLDRGDTAAAPVVKRYRLESVPVPLILVIAANGVAASGTKPSAVTASKLARMVPSPSKAAYLKALEERKAVFLVFAGEKTTGRLGAIEACNAAVKAMADKAATVTVDLADDREAAFTSELNVDRATTVAVTIVVNSRAQRTATFDTVPDAKALVEAAAKVVEECCPGGKCK